MRRRRVARRRDGLHGHAPGRARRERRRRRDVVRRLPQRRHRAPRGLPRRAPALRAPDPRVDRAHRARGRARQARRARRERRGRLRALAADEGLPVDLLGAARPIDATTTVAALFEDEREYASADDRRNLRGKWRLARRLLEQSAVYVEDLDDDARAWWRSKRAWTERRCAELTYTRSRDAAGGAPYRAPPWPPPLTCVVDRTDECQICWVGCKELCSGADGGDEPVVKAGRRPPRRGLAFTPACF